MSKIELEFDYIPVIRPDGTMLTLTEIEDAAIDFALTHLRPSDAARALGIGRSTLYRRIDKLKNGGY